MQSAPLRRVPQETGAEEEEVEEREVISFDISINTGISREGLVGSKPSLRPSALKARPSYMVPSHQDFDRMPKRPQW